MPRRHDLARRVGRCALGLVLFGIGVTLIIEAHLGLGPWDVFHQGLHEITGIPIGTVIILVGALLLVLWIPLRQRVGLGTLLNAVLIGSTVDATLPVTPTAGPLALRVAYLAGGILLVAVGSGYYIGSGLGPGPRDGLMVGLHERFGLSIRASRTVIEVTALVSGWALGGSVGVGTVLFALTIGPLVQVFLPRLRAQPLARARATRA
jgi:uncharacterized membrane protein YczE